ncbi:MAG: hypothetical protein SVG88_09975 [Halobacteriales archaeon]|nr:hypothetical protein [Halobacteriales archaeon]
MPTDTVATDSDVMASIDDHGTSADLIIADLSTEDAWVSIAATDAPVLDEMR